MDMVVIEDYLHIMTILGENVNWVKLAHLLLKFSWNLMAPFVHKTLLKLFNSIFKCTNHTHTKKTKKLKEKEKEKLSIMYYTMYANASYNTPSYTHISSYIVLRFYPQVCTN